MQDVQGRHPNRVRVLQKQVEVLQETEYGAGLVYSLNAGHFTFASPQAPAFGLQTVEPGAGGAGAGAADAREGFRRRGSGGQVST